MVETCVPLLERVFRFFDDYPCWITGSVLRHCEKANDIDVMFPASANLRDICHNVGATYRGAFPIKKQDGTHIIRQGTLWVSFLPIGKVINLIQDDHVEQPEQHPWMCQKRDGTFTNVGKFYEKPSKDSHAAPKV